MADDSSKGVLNIRNFPAQLRRRLKIRALEREMDLQDLVKEYLTAALEKDESQKQPPRSKRVL